MELGQHDEAIAVFDDVVNRFGQVKAPGAWGGPVGEWAAVTKPMAIRRGNPNAPDVAIDAYEAYLVEFAQGDYAAFAYLELGDLYQTTGDLKKARECYLSVLSAGEHWEASDAANRGLNAVDAKLRAASVSSAEKE